MQKSFSRSAAARPRQSKTFLVFFSGLIVGLIIAVAIALYITRAPTPTLTKSVQPSTSTNIPIQKVTPPTTPDDNALVDDPNRALHNQVPENQTPEPSLTTPPKSIEAVAARETPHPSNYTAKPNTSVQNNHNQPNRYILQIAAYTTAEEAERQKAKLAMQGYEINVSPYETNGVKYYRLRMGPFTQLQDAEQAKAKLALAKIDALLIKTSN